MKKTDLFDLLDACSDDRVDLRQEVPLSPDRIRELTMKNIHTNTNHRRTKRFTTGLLIAAALAAVMSVTAIAGYVLGAGALFQDFFASPDGGSLSEAQIETLDKVSNRFEGGITSEGATITPIAALADANVYYLRLRVDAPEGVVLPDRGDDATGYYQFFGSGESIDVDLDGGYSTFLQTLPDENPEDGQKEFVLIFHAQPGTGITFNDGTSKVLTLHGLWVQDADKDYHKIFGGEFTFDIGLHFESNVLKIPCKGLKWTSPDVDYTSTLQSMELSPLSLHVRYSPDFPPDLDVISVPGPFSIVLQNGTELDPLEDMDWGPSGSEGLDNADLFIFNSPLDLNQVDHIQFGDHVIPVNPAA